MGLVEKIFGKKAETPAAPPPKAPASNGVEKAKNDLGSRKSKLDQMEADALGGQKYKNGGLVKATPKSTPYKCK